MLGDGDVDRTRTITGARHFEQERKITDPRVSDECREPLCANGAFTDVRVAIAVAAELDLRVVQVECAQAAHADAELDLFNEALRARHG